MLEKSLLAVLTCIYAVILIWCLANFPSQTTYGIGFALLAGLVGFCAGDPDLKKAFKEVFSAVRENPLQAAGLLGFAYFLGYFFWVVYAAVFLGLLAFVLSLWTLTLFDFVARTVRRRL